MQTCNDLKFNFHQPERKTTIISLEDAMKDFLEAYRLHPSPESERLEVQHITTGSDGRPLITVYTEKGRIHSVVPRDESPRQVVQDFHFDGLDAGDLCFYSPKAHYRIQIR